MRVRLLDRLEQDALVLVTQPADVHYQRHAPRRHARLEVEKGLQRQLVELGRLVGQQADLID